MRYKLLMTYYYVIININIIYDIIKRIHIQVCKQEKNNSVHRPIAFCRLIY